MSKTRRLAGFTLIEILVVVALIAILTAITFIAINPGKNFADARDTTRATHVSQILNAVSQYLTKPGNTLITLAPNALATATAIPVCTTNISGDVIGTAGIDLTAPLVTAGDYIVGIPVDPNTVDPLTAGLVDSGYRICVTGTRVQISGDAEGANTIISVKR